MFTAIEADQKDSPIYDFECIRSLLEILTPLLKIIKPILKLEQTIRNAQKLSKNYLYQFENSLRSQPDLTLECKYARRKICQLQKEISLLKSNNMEFTKIIKSNHLLDTYVLTKDIVIDQSKPVYDIDFKKLIVCFSKNLDLIESNESRLYDLNVNFQDISSKYIKLKENYTELQTTNELYSKEFEEIENLLDKFKNYEYIYIYSKYNQDQFKYNKDQLKKSKYNIDQFKQSKYNIDQFKQSKYNKDQFYKSKYNKDQFYQSKYNEYQVKNDYVMKESEKIKNYNDNNHTEKNISYNDKNHADKNKYEIWKLNYPHKIKKWAYDNKLNRELNSTELDEKNYNAFLQDQKNIDKMY